MNSDRVVSLTKFSATGCKQWEENTQTCMNKVYTASKHMFTKTHSNGQPMSSRILCNTLLVQNCGDNRHILAPGVYVAVKLTQLFTQ